MSGPNCKHDLPRSECAQCFNEFAVPVDAYLDARREAEPMKRLEESATPTGYFSINIHGQQGKKIKHLKDRGGRLLSAVVQIQMPDGSVATIDDWGKTTWKDS